MKTKQESEPKLDPRVSERLKDLSVKFERPLSTIAQIPTQVSERQKVPHGLSMSSLLVNGSDDESIFEDEIFFSGAFDVH